MDCLELFEQMVSRNLQLTYISLVSTVSGHAFLDTEIKESGDDPSSTNSGCFLANIGLDHSPNAIAYTCFRCDKNPPFDGCHSLD